jgi:hypothetical protein
MRREAGGLTPPLLFQLSASTLHKIYHPVSSHPFLFRVVHSHSVPVLWAEYVE